MNDSPGKASNGPKEHEKRPKGEQNNGADVRGKQSVKQAKDNNSQSGEAPKENFIHVRARRGQATNSHSLAERVPSLSQNICYDKVRKSLFFFVCLMIQLFCLQVRREKISERMRLLQELVPGCNKVI